MLPASVAASPSPARHHPAPAKAPFSRNETSGIHPPWPVAVGIANVERVSDFIPQLPGIPVYNWRGLVCPP